MSFVTFTLKEKNQIFNMRLIALTLQRCLHNEGYINVIEQQAQRQIAIEVNNKDDADKVQRWLDDEGLVY
jgi:phosphoribosylformylglycinamidine (FGAM) synthase PurS component